MAEMVADPGADHDSTPGERISEEMATTRPWLDCNRSVSICRNAAKTSPKRDTPATISDDVILHVCVQDDQKVQEAQAKQ
jgi:hypothetical protein